MSAAVRARRPRGPATLPGPLGAVPERGGVTFRVWAPDARSVEIVAADRRVPLRREARGFHTVHVPGLAAGDRYRFSLDGGVPLPDPASRSQPEGVHGPSEIVDPGLFPWSDGAWRGPRLEDLVLYELHVGTFTPEGTFAAATARLPELADLGVTAIELMPVADFPGMRNWGYDGAALFAPARCYGRPDDLRRLVDAAHRLGLAVHLDVVYNHFGPDGAYAAAFSRRFFSERHRTPWGAGINLDGDHAAEVREIFTANALHWLREYHVDGLRFDAVHAMADESPQHFLAELESCVREALPDRPTLLVAEDARNLAHIVRPVSEGGWGLDAVWADDFHHELRRLLAGDSDGYFADFRGNTEDLAMIVNRGWLFSGQSSAYFGGVRGSDPSGVPPPRFVLFIQNHDQIGNRAFGERLHHQVEPATYRAAVALLLGLPQTPLLFMGQEWGASTPFLFFTDHQPELGRLVTEGRREEFKRFPSFLSESARGRIPDPQALETFEKSRLLWEEREREPHASVLRLHRALLALRRSEPAWRAAPIGGHEAAAIDSGTLAVRRHPVSGAAVLTVVRLAGAGPVEVPSRFLAGTPAGRWERILTTEDPEFAPEPRPIVVRQDEAALSIRFERPGGVILRGMEPDA
jgi:maltooligosyltrehalose trehalohydrolase